MQLASSKISGELYCNSEWATSSGACFDSINPTNIAGTAKTNPAIGPAIPMSNNACRERIGDLIRMNAPMVPISVGAGTKKGSVAYTR